MTAANAITSVVENAQLNHLRPHMLMLCTKLLKRLQDDKCQCHAQLLQALTSLIMVSGNYISAQTPLMASTMVQLLTTPDWMIRKAACDGLAAICTRTSKDTVVAFQEQVLEALEQCRQDKIKTVRDAVHSTISLYKSLFESPLLIPTTPPLLASRLSSPAPSPSSTPILMSPRNLFDQNQFIPSPHKKHGASKHKEVIGSSISSLISPSQPSSTSSSTTIPPLNLTKHSLLTPKSPSRGKSSSTTSTSTPYKAPINSASISNSSSGSSKSLLSKPKNSSGSTSKSSTSSTTTTSWNEGDSQAASNKIVTTKKPLSSPLVVSQPAYVVSQSNVGSANNNMSASTTSSMPMAAASPPHSPPPAPKHVHVQTSQSLSQESLQGGGSSGGGTTTSTPS
ncbi:hypothetical protein SAMD00019534_107390 [Acytostelium subglobosum LB1]|uniref:hypothetical protein n=1 Tax=Acytostelium subglobosum LB1 TaxID=1410327 RepID=UPI000644B7F1|nr:hypothetical protein SAMD00019534_107390 [Acytostelium subglobosum LB1]GAM27563.1 hypothetical protein SAMD00019534_107390 [Acytostelium subglobosum LB1]|eukprot:XP_012749628.1 hypothetical protein SAMD00019534_107390 [Acytostelium subglobosum LB1]